MVKFQTSFSRQRRKTGTFALLTLMLAIMVLLPIGLFTFEIARINLAQKELKAVTDSAALAAAVAISQRNSEDPDELLQAGRQAGLMYLRRNSICSQDLTNSSLSTNVEGDNPAVGTGTFDVTFDQSRSVVTAKASFGMLPAFGSLFGVKTTTVRGQSNATTAAATTGNNDVVVLFDYSESMEEGGVFGPARATASAFLGRLTDPGLHVGLTYFALSPEVAVPLSMTQGNALAAKASMDNLVDTKFGTNTGDALLEAIKQLNGSGHRQGANKVIVLITDGLARKPGGLAEGTRHALDAADEAKAAGVTIYSVGFFHPGSEDLQAGKDFVDKLKLRAGGESESYTASTIGELDRVLQSIKMPNSGGVALVN